MTKIKLESSLSGAADIALEHLRAHIYSRPGMRVMAVVELMHTERTEPAPGEDKEPSVKLGVKFLEVARGEQQDEQLRKVLAILKLQRTAEGTFDEQLQALELKQSTLEDCADNMAWLETARLRAALAMLADQVGRLAGITLDQRKQKDALRRLAKVAEDALAGVGDGSGGPL